MALLADNIKLWCQEESLSLVPRQGDESALSCVITLPGDPPLSVDVTASPDTSRRILLSHTAPLPATQDSSDPDAPQRVAALLERVAASRSALVDCRLLQGEGEPTAQIVVTLHEEGVSKHSFLSALGEIGKVRRVIAWEMETMALTLGLVSDIRSCAAEIAQRTEALASDAAEAVAAAGASAAPTRPPPPAAEPPPPQPPAPAPPPAPVPPPTAAAASLFCPNCGRQARPGARFCSGCGASLEG